MRSTPRSTRCASASARRPSRAPRCSGATPAWRPSSSPATAARENRRMELPAPFHWRAEHIGASLPGGEVLFSTRRGGVSPGRFASLNLGRLTDDDGANVDENRERLPPPARRPPAGLLLRP